MKLRRRSVITREGWYYLFILAFVVFGSLLRHIDLLVGLSAILAVAMLLNWRMTKASLRQLSFQRRDKDSVWCHQPTVFEVEVENGRRQMSSFSVMVSQDFRPKRLLRQKHRELNFVERIVRWFQGSSIKNYVLLDSVHVEETRVAQQTLEFRDRGEYEMGPLIVSTHFPLGLVRRELTDFQRLPLFVGPALGKLSYGWVDRMLGLGWQDASGGTTARSGDEFFSLRPFASGDSRRRIHWRASARHGAMLVRQFQRSQSKAFSMVLDLFALQAAVKRVAAGSGPANSNQPAGTFSQSALNSPAVNNPAVNNAVLSDEVTEEILRIVATISETVHSGHADTASLYLVGDQVHEVSFPCNEMQWKKWHECLSTVSATVDSLQFFRFLKSQGERIGLSGMGNASPVVVLSSRTLDAFSDEVKIAERQQVGPVIESQSHGDAAGDAGPESNEEGLATAGRQGIGESSLQSEGNFQYSSQDFWQIQRQIRTWLTPGDNRLATWYLDAPRWQTPGSKSSNASEATGNFVPTELADGMSNAVEIQADQASSHSS